jgi:uncharacterized protein (DUF934 family)
MLIRWRDGRAWPGEDPFTFVFDDEPVPPGDVVVSLSRFRREGHHLAGEARALGVRLATEDAPEDLAGDLNRLTLVELAFPRFRDGRPYSAARVLRERLGFAGELRAVGEVLLEQAAHMVRCGFDAFAPADGSDPEAWTHAARRFRHVYQRAADGRAPAFAERWTV